MFSLIVDYFGIEYVEERYTKHLLSDLEQHYTVTTDWEGKKYASINLHWNYQHRTFRLYMNG